MVIPERLQTYWTAIELGLKALRAKVANSLALFCDAQNFPLSGRIKTVESVAEKIESGRYEKISDLEDLVGFTVIVPTQEQLGLVVTHCREVFDVASVKHRSDYRKAPSEFWFDSIRIKCKLKPVAGDDDAAVIRINEYYFEVRVRTAFEHAWSTATHALAYKSHKIDWGRLRLSWQIKATVEMLARIFHTSE